MVMSLTESIALDYTVKFIRALAGLRDPGVSLTNLKILWIGRQCGLSESGRIGI
jgi:hypothetical protein